MLRRLHYLILALLSSYSLHSQSVTSKSLKDKLIFHRITTEQGLPSDIIHCIYQDEKGFIWLGSSNGLCRYDGSRMIVYQYNPKDSFSISDNDILSITSHSSGKLAIGTYGGGVNILDQNINQFINSHNQKNNPVFVPNEIHTIAAIDTSHLAITNGQLK